MQARNHETPKRLKGAGLLFIVRLSGQQRILLVAVVAEIAVFSAIAQNFFTAANFFEVMRFSVELGLLALALTPIIITGGIDLSIGSMMGLAAVLFGAASRDWHLPVAAAAAIALAAGCAGGALNATLVAGLGIPPLIVTLGSLSLFRGIAEGMTHAAVNYSGFPERFLFLGQGYLWRTVPAQLPIFLVVIVGYVVLLHTSIVGRAWYAIGASAAGARYAGIAVSRRLGLAYILSGAIASVAAIIYVAHLGQARSDAGAGYELDAITAVVLGGASVFGGRGTLSGTLLGLFAISILQNGLHLAALPSELTGVLTGTLLVATIAADRWRVRRSASVADVEQGEILCATILAGAFIVAATNVWLIRSIAPASRAGSDAATPVAGHRPIIAMMPKAKGDPYFVSCRAGAEEAAKELGVDLIWDGPTSLDAAKQNELVENWITRKVDVIAVAVENRAAISTVLKKANQNEWIRFIRKRVSDKYPALTIATIRPSDDDRDKAFAETQTILKVHPSVRLMMAISAPAVPGSAEAVRQAGRTDVRVIGLSLPNINKPYVHDGIVQTVVLWNTRDLGYLSVYAGSLLREHKLQAGARSLQAGRLGTLEVRGSEIVLGPPLMFTKANIDRFDF